PAAAKIIWSKSAGICAFPGCRKRLIVEAANRDPTALVGEIAHIVAHSGEGPRSEVQPPGGQIDGGANLLLLCGAHHKQVDRQPKRWTVEQLVGVKEIHERWVRESLSMQEADADPGPLVEERVHSSLMRADVMPLRVYMAPTTIAESHIKTYL